MPSSIDELSWNGRVFPLLLALREAKTMNASQFHLKSEVSPTTAKDLRTRMEKARLLDVTVHYRKGAVEVLDIRLSRKGARAAEGLTRVDEVLREDDDPQPSG